MTLSLQKTINMATPVQTTTTEILQRTKSPIIDELKDRLAALTAELEALDADLQQLLRADQLRSHAREVTERYRREIRRFLELETVTNADMRRIIDHICVSDDGNVKVVLKQLEDMD